MAKPPQHGQLKLTTWKTAHAKAHLALVTQSMADVHDYGSHGDIRQSSEGAFSGGASSGEYSTGSTDSVGDSDSGVPGPD